VNAIQKPLTDLMFSKSGFMERLAKFDADTLLNFAFISDEMKQKIEKAFM
jgi:hypothetical protein